MGKHNNRRRFRGSGVRNNPINGQEISLHENGCQMEESEEDILSRISSQLASASSEDRECGLSSLAQLDKIPSLTDIRSHRFLKIVAPMMVDTNVSVKHAAVGALKNLSLASPEVCEEMIEQDIMTPLCTLLMAYTEDWSPVVRPTPDLAKKETVFKIDSKTEIYVEAIGLLANLAEASPTVVRFINDKQMLPFILNHTNVEKFGPDVTLVTLQCVYSLSEDNEAAATVLRQYESSLKSLIEKNPSNSSEWLEAILVYGIFMNISKSQMDSDLQDSLLPGLMTTIANILEQDQRKLLHDLTSLAPMEYENSDLKTIEDDSGTALRSEIDRLIRSQLTSLEIFTNICCDDSTEEWEDNESSSGDDDGGMAATEDTDMTAETFSASLPTVILEAVASHGLVSKILAKLSLPAVNVIEMLQQDKQSSNLFTLAKALRSRAFLCLSNLVPALGVEDLGGPDGLFNLWTQLGQACFTSEEAKVDVEFEESATSALRAVTQKLFDARLDKFIKVMSKEDLQKIIDTGASSSDASVRTNIVNIVGNIGVLQVCTTSPLPSTAAQLPLLSLIVAFLLEAAARDVDVRVVAEALDKIIDIFSEDETDPLCADFHLVTRLKQMLPGLKVKIGMLRRQTRPKADDTLGIVSMAKTNLVRFIKYKENRKK